VDKNYGKEPFCYGVRFGFCSYESSKASSLFYGQFLGFLSIFLQTFAKHPLLEICEYLLLRDYDKIVQHQKSAKYCSLTKMQAILRNRLVQ
jgi:hypothetical protein